MRSYSELKMSLEACLEKHFHQTPINFKKPIIELCKIGQLEPFHVVHSLLIWCVENGLPLCVTEVVHLSFNDLIDESLNLPHVTAEEIKELNTWLDEMDDSSNWSEEDITPRYMVSFDLDSDIAPWEKDQEERPVDEEIEFEQLRDSVKSDILDAFKSNTDSRYN